jgi:hypothetical protein
MGGRRKLFGSKWLEASRVFAGCQPAPGLAAKLSSVSSHSTLQNRAPYSRHQIGGSSRFRNPAAHTTATSGARPEEQIVDAGLPRAS